MSKKRILLIEDDPNIRESTHEILELYGFESFSAGNGREGIIQARKNLPHLILCDIMMPELDGFGVLQELRKDPSTAAIPFIFLTAKTEPQDIRGGMALGADDYLLKPVNPEDLITSVKSRLARQETFSKNLEDLHTSLSNSVPHEFRTPLSGILGFAQIITMNVREKIKMSDEELLEYISMIESSGQRLLRLIETYTLFSEVTTTLATGSFSPSDPAGSDWIPPLENSIHKLATQYQREKDLHITWTNTSLQVSAYFLQKAIFQLVDNAFKFSKPGMPVCVKGTPQGSPGDASYVFSITDQGQGMTPEEIGRIGPYVQFNRGQHEQQGSGLGLVISQKIAKILRGALAIESTPGKGTIIRLTVPAIAE